MRLAVLLSVCALLWAHTFHYSRTEMNWNTEAKTLEIIATLHADDVESQLRKTRRQLELDRDKDAEPLVCAYVIGALDLASLKPRCIGMKVSRDYVEVFLEAPVTTPPKSLRNRILIEDFTDQRNDVELKKNGRFTGPRIQFNSSETRKDLRW